MKGRQVENGVVVVEVLEESDQTLIDWTVDRGRPRVALDSCSCRDDRSSIRGALCLGFAKKRMSIAPLF